MKKLKQDKGNSILGGLFWSFGERITAQLVTTVVTIILARILDPAHYGVISIVTIFVTFCNIFVSSGFGSALVQKKDATDEDFNTAFVISLSLSIFLYILLFISSPYIASFYNMPELTMVIRVMGIRLIVAALNTIQHAYIRKQMKFKKFFYATLFGTVISAIVGIILAINGYGVWALVAQYLTNTTIDSIVLLFVAGWRPKIQFNKISAKKMFSFGWKVLITDLIYTLEADVRSLIIGKVFSPSDLAYFDNGKKYPSLFVSNINNSINKVMLPAYSKTQDNLENLKKILRKSIKVGIYILSPILIGFAIVASGFVSIFLTDKWLAAVPFIQIFCISYLTRPLESSCHQALLSIGESGIVMYIMLFINIASLVVEITAAFVFKNVLLIAIGNLVATFVSIALFMHMVHKKIGYTPKEQFMDLKYSILASLLMGVVVYLVGLINIAKIPLFIVQIVVGMVVYISLSKIMKIDGFIYMVDKCKKILKR